MPLSQLDSSAFPNNVGFGTQVPVGSAKMTISYPGNQLYFQDTRNANTATVGLITYNQDGNFYFDSNTLSQSGAGSGYIWRSQGTQLLALNSSGTVTLSGEFRQIPPPTYQAAYTTGNRTNVESAIVAAYQGTSGTVSGFSTPAGTNYVKKFFNMSSTAGGTFNQTMVEIDGRSTNFHELWVRIVWGTRIQGISDSASAMCERAYGCNKFNGQLINYAISNSWSHIDGNSDTYMDINVVNSPTTGMLLVQFQEASPTSGSSFIWGYIEIMSVEVLGDGGNIPIKFNC